MSISISCSRSHVDYEEWSIWNFSLLFSFNWWHLYHWHFSATGLYHEYRKCEMLKVTHIRSYYAKLMDIRYRLCT